MWWRKRRELKSELEEHLALEAQWRVDAGEPADEAMHAARRDFGNVTLIEEEARAAPGRPILRKSPRGAGCTTSSRARLHRRRAAARRACRPAQRWTLAPALRRRARYSRQDNSAKRRAVRSGRRHASRVPLSAP